MKIVIGSRTNLNLHNSHLITWKNKNAKIKLMTKINQIHWYWHLDNFCLEIWHKELSCIQKIFHKPLINIINE